ncbi:thiolase family protein [Candidatus Nanopelagicales bacterium]|nr:thiolase family protein [Candidatus Nanopelagicales bacterium]
MTLRDAVIVGAVRTPVGVGKPVKGNLSGVHPVDLSAVALQGLVQETGIDPGVVDDVIWGCVSQVGEQSFNIGRNAALTAGFPESVSGVTIDRQCGSSQQAASFAAAGVMSGQYDVAIAGGVEVMSRVPMFSSGEGGDGPYSQKLQDRYEGRLVPQGISAEMIAERWNLSRTELDQIAVDSHENAARASKDGLFADEIVSVATEAGDVAEDQGIRPGTTLDSLSALRTPFKEDGVVTAGNASQISDGAAALLIMTSDKAKELGLQPIARFHSFAVAGVDPVIMLTGPIPATQKVLAGSGLSLSDIGVFEVNEAFASVVGAWYADTGADRALTNPNGGAIALGHPLGGSGARLMTTMVHHMRRENIKYGLQTMCEGGGMANATILELL